MKERENFENHPDLDTVKMIVGKINGGDETAWQQLVGQIQDHLTLMARNNLSQAVRGHINPSDIVQQTMLEVVKGIGNFRGTTKAEFFAWLNQIVKIQATRIARDLTRQKRDVRKQFSMHAKNDEATNLIEFPDRLNTPGTNAIAVERLELMERALKNLPEKYERVIRMRSLDDEPHEKIAEKMNRSVGAVTKLWYRAMVKLREELTRLQDESRQ